MDDMKVLKRLKKGRALLSDPARWRKGEYSGRISSEDRRMSYCMLGATGLTRNSPIGEENAITEALRAGLAAIGYRSLLIWSFNDAPETTHEDVLKAYDAAIAQLEEKVGSNA